jgi:hypothetical protein
VNDKGASSKNKNTTKKKRCLSDATRAGRSANKLGERMMKKLLIIPAVMAAFVVISGSSPAMAYGHHWHHWHHRHYWGCGY